MPSDRYAASYRDGLPFAPEPHSGPRRAKRAKEMLSNQARALQEYQEQGPWLVLASASPRRADLLRAAGIEFDVTPADVDESMDVKDQPDGYARRVAQLKAEAVIPQARGRSILGADTIVVVDNEVLGKPADAADARRMLGLLSGRAHTVLTAVCLLNPAAELGGVQTDVAWHERGVCAAQPRGDSLVRGQRRNRRQGRRLRHSGPCLAVRHPD